MHSHPTPATSPTSRPATRWAGSKSRLVPQLIPLLPPGRRLIKLFLGAGALFLATAYESYSLCVGGPRVGRTSESGFRKNGRRNCRPRMSEISLQQTDTDTNS
ncbi:UNVERIFIED_ORG: DNA adenine methylase [Shinella sp. XGS7]